MIIDMSIEERDFIITLIEDTYLDDVVEKLQQAEMVSDCEVYVRCGLAKSDVEAIVGELSFEANHTRSKQKATMACDIAELLESELLYGNNNAQ